VALLGLLAHSLSAAEPGLRVDRTGDPLPAGALARLGTTRFRHPTGQASVDVSPDGKLVAGAGGRTVCVWDADGKEVERFRGKAHGDIVAFTSDGKVLLAAATNGTVEHWDVASGTLLFRMPSVQLGAAYHWGGFSPDRRLLVLTDFSNQAVLLSVNSGNIVRRFIQEHGLYVLAVSHDGKQAAGGGSDGVVRVWEVATGKEVRRFEGGERTGLFSLCFSPDGTALLASGGPGDTSELRLFDLGSGKTLFTVAEAAAGGRLAFTPDGKRFASVHHGTAYLCDARTGKELHRLERHTDWIVAVPAFSADGRVLVTGGEDHVAEVWDPASGKSVHAFDGHRGDVTALSFSPDGKSLASGGRDGVLLEWDLARGKPRLRCPGHYQQVVCLAYAPDGRTIVSGDGQSPYGQDDREAQVRVLDRATGKPERQFTGHLNGVLSLAFIADGKGLASSGLDARIRLWDRKSGERLRLARVDQGYRRVRASPDGKTLVTFTAFGEVSLWTADTLEKIRTLREPERGPVTGLDALFLPDGKTVVYAELVIGDRVRRSGNIRVCFQDAVTGQVIRETRIPADRDLGSGACWVLSPDGTLLGLGEHPWPPRLSAVRLWDTGTGKPLPPLLGHFGGIATMCFSPDGKTLASGGADTTILLWDVGRARREHLWIGLGGTPEEADQAARVLRAGGPEEIAFLAQHLKEAIALEGRASAHIDRLDADDFAAREKATRELEALGPRAELALRLALEGQPSPEVRRRAQAVLDGLKRQPGDPAVPSPRAILRALLILEERATSEARKALEELAGGEESSQIVRSAHAAVERLNPKR
jgi:WD40 repeat protein